MLRNCVFGAYRPPATNRIDKFLKRGREWREKRDYATLDYLTTQLIDRVPYQPIPVSKIVEVMGEADSVVDRCYTFFSKDKEKRTGYLPRNGQTRKSDGMEAGQVLLTSPTLALVRRAVEC
jgi:hypothetical protein